MAAMLMTKILSADTDIRWGTDTVTVQDYGLVRVMNRAGSDDPVALKRQDGSEFQLAAQTFEALYGGTVRDRVYKPLRNPHEAWVTEEPTEVEIGGRVVQLAEGDAILRDKAGGLTVVPALQYVARFRATVD